MLTLCASSVSARAVAQARPADAIVREAEAEFRRQVNEYQGRLRQLDFSHRPSASARRGMTDTIVNNHRSHLTAITRARDDARRRLIGLRISTRERNDALRSLTTVYNTEVRTLKGHEDDALRRLREAERR
jgi:hypothetical protein